MISYPLWQEIRGRADCARKHCAIFEPHFGSFCNMNDFLCGPTYGIFVDNFNNSTLEESWKEKKKSCSRREETTIIELTLNYDHLGNNRQRLSNLHKTTTICATIDNDYRTHTRLRPLLLSKKRGERCMDTTARTPPYWHDFCLFAPTRQCD